MPDTGDFMGEIRKGAERLVLFLPHAVRQMSRPERMISASEIRRVLNEGRVIEDYPDDPRGHSCLVMGRGKNGRPVHVVCSPKKDFLAIITAYVPDAKEWNGDFAKRREP